MHIAAKLDDIGRPAWIALTVVSFIIWWPIGLAALAFTNMERTHGMRMSRTHGAGGSAASGGARCAMNGGP